MKIEIQEKLGVKRGFELKGIIVGPVGIIIADIDTTLLCLYGMESSREYQD